LDNVRTQVEATPETQVKKQTLAEQLNEEMKKWQTKIDEAKVQLHLGAKEVRDEIQPHVDKLEQEFNQANEQWQELENATESALGDIHRGLKGSLKTMQKSFEKAQQHFQKQEKK
jgi:predicted  nucleic acid-binding Zn-ribbon protein